MMTVRFEALTHVTTIAFHYHTIVVSVTAQMRDTMGYDSTDPWFVNFTKSNATGTKSTWDWFVAH